jgi:hypothetical protein
MVRSFGQKENMAIAVLLGLAAFLCLLLAPSSLPPSNRLASLGVAWWLAGCGLVPFTAYHAWRTAQLDSDPYE